MPIWAFMAYLGSLLFYSSKSERQSQLSESGAWILRKGFAIAVMGYNKIVTIRQDDSLLSRSSWKYSCR